jgi:hypothetical protein
LVSAALILLPAPGALADQLQRLSIETLARRAPVIVEGRVAAKRSEWNADGTKIYTIITLAVDEYHKGGLNENSLDIRYLGGSVGDITMAVMGQPTFALNERVFLFLGPDYTRKDQPFAGNAEGKRVISTDPVTGEDQLTGIHMTIDKTEAIATVDRVMSAVRGVEE